MIELFSDIPEDIKAYAETMFNFSLIQNNVEDAAFFLNNCIKNFDDDYIKTFLNFYFNMRLEALINESSNSER